MRPRWCPVRRLSAREEFCLWAGKQGWSTDTTETVLASSAKLHKLGEQEANGLRTVGEVEHHTQTLFRVLGRLRSALALEPWEPFTSDGWITLRLCGKRHPHDRCTGRAVPR